MLNLIFRRVREDRVDQLRAWMSELMRRHDEVRATFVDEGVMHEMAYLLQTAEGPVIVFASESTDPERARQAYRQSTHPIDQEHRRTMSEVLLEGSASAEKIYELRR